MIVAVFVAYVITIGIIVLRPNKSIKHYDDKWPVYATEEYAEALREYEQQRNTTLGKTTEVV